MCRDFLMAVRSVCHRLVMTEEIREEWERHSSGFSRSWRVAMVGLRKEIPRAPDQIPALDQYLDSLAISDEVRLAMRKDKRLVEAALATDRIVISLDERVRGHFGSGVASVPDLARIIWVNPGVEAEQAIDWLRGGAKLENSRRLGR